MKIEVFTRYGKKMMDVEVQENSVVTQGKKSVSGDGFPYFDFRFGGITWEEFLKNYFTKLTQTKSVSSSLVLPDLADVYALVEKSTDHVDMVLMNALTYSDVRKWGRDVLDVENRAESLRAGFMATVWGAGIFVCRKVPTGFVLAVSEEAKVGALMELGQEEYYNLKGLNALREEASRLQQRMGAVYREMDGLINEALSHLTRSST